MIIINILLAQLYPNTMCHTVLFGLEKCSAQKVSILINLYENVALSPMVILLFSYLVKWLNIPENTILRIN